jgi:hypothetical protein
MARMRTVVEDFSVTDKVYAESDIYPRLEEAFDALKWWLSHSPESGELIDDINWMYKQRGNAKLNIPALVVIYTFDRDTVQLFHLLVRLPPL